METPLLTKEQIEQQAELAGPEPPTRSRVRCLIYVWCVIIVVQSILYHSATQPMRDAINTWIGDDFYRFVLVAILDIPRLSLIAATIKQTWWMAGPLRFQAYIEWLRRVNGTVGLVSIAMLMLGHMLGSILFDQVWSMVLDGPNGSNPPIIIRGAWIVGRFHGNST